jgi:hypothetical protein
VAAIGTFRDCELTADGFSFLAEAVGGFDFFDGRGGGADFAGGVAKVDGDFADLAGGSLGLFQQWFDLGADGDNESVHGGADAVLGAVDFFGDGGEKAFDFCEV